MSEGKQTTSAIQGMTKEMESMGAYTARRASALSGVPLSTIHWWSRNDVLVPEVRSLRVKLWSYADLMGLRVVYWLRRRKTDALGVDIPGSSMEAVRRALAGLRQAKLSLWDGAGARVFVSGEGMIYFEGHGGHVQNLDGQLARGDILDLVQPFPTAEGLRGPDLVRPKLELRIVPNKLSGSPHVAETRVETQAVAALAHDGLEAEGIVSLYPFLSTRQVAQALELERELAANLAADVAA